MKSLSPQGRLLELVFEACSLVKRPFLIERTPVFTWGRDRASRRHRAAEHSASRFEKLAAAAVANPARS